MPDNLVVGMGVSVAVTGALSRHRSLESAAHAWRGRAVLFGAANRFTMHSIIFHTGMSAVISA